MFKTVMLSVQLCEFIFCDMKERRSILKSPAALWVQYTHGIRFSNTIQLRCFIPSEFSLKIYGYRLCSQTPCRGALDGAVNTQESPYDLLKS